ncbi:putative plastid-lipid-associated protein [Helianthus annuus]|uniref:Plastid-lipid-associated protein n=1 Tax=Helianthus annuus TaxID=4232 RepID=A0A251S637_HELAN|nr:probable plastid-lipid-associated protein 10, chloroplastic [Helianthus annuus]KAF5761633.1 putative plastid-lipid-associated protein [Helianthus annuus]
MGLLLPFPTTPTLFRRPPSSTIFLPLSRNILRCSAATLTTPQQQRNELDLENKKYDLLRVIQDTQRGLVTTPNQRSEIEESLVDLESYAAGDDEAIVDLGVLDGTWRLLYTSASDVLVLLDSSSKLPFFQVGPIFQKFECKGQDDGGYVRNVVRWSIPSLLEENEGATLLVSAKFSVVSRRNIFLEFEEIALQNIIISDELQALIAPALLPRSFFSLQILQAIRTFKAQIPVNSTSPGRRSVGGLYYLSYLDKNMLVGRAVGGGGVFVFSRAQNIL